MADETQLSEKERINILKKHEANMLNFKKYKEQLRTVDLTKNSTIQFKTYSKDKLRNMLKNPASETNQKDLRRLSNFLYTVSHVYKRLIKFKAHQLPLRSWTAYPNVPIGEEPDESTIMTNYEKVCSYVKNMDMKSQALKIMTSLWLNDVYYGFCYGDPADKSKGFFIHTLDPDYCKICAQDFHGGVLHIAFDFSFFNGDNKFYLDVYDKVFRKLYRRYQKDSSLRWQELPVERTACFKLNVENIMYPVPPLSGLFPDIIDLVDLREIQNLKDELEAYKLIVAKIDTIQGTKDVDDFAIDLDLANAFYEKMKSALPDNVALAMSPMDIQTVDFQSNTANDTNIVNKAYENIINANGGIVLNQNRITSSTAFKLALMFDTMDATDVVEQINAWLDLYLYNHLGDTGITVEFDNTSPFFIDDKIDKLLKVNQYSIPAKMQLSSLVIHNPVKERGMSYLENMLGITKTTWNNPLISSNVQGAYDGNDGRPTKDDGDLSDEGIATRDDDKNNN